MAMFDTFRVAVVASESAPLLDQIAQTVAVLAGSIAIIAVLYFGARWLSRHTNV